MSNKIINQLFQTKPSSVDGLNNISTQYYTDYLYDLLKSIFILSNPIDTWDYDYFMNRLIEDGSIGAVINPKTNIPYCLKCGRTGINVYGKETELIVANHVLGSWDAKVGETGELIYYSRGRDSQIRNCKTLVRMYAEMLASCDCSINVSLINSRVAHIFYARNKSQKATYEKVYDLVSSGKPSVVLYNPNGDYNEMKENDFADVKGNYIANDVILTKHSIMNEFLTVIGIANCNTDKRERLTTDEVSVNQPQTRALISKWKLTLNQCMDRVNEMYRKNGIESNMSIDYNDEVIQMLKEQFDMDGDNDDE